MSGFFPFYCYGFKVTYFPAIKDQPNRQHSLKWTHNSSFMEKNYNIQNLQVFLLALIE